MNYNEMKSLIEKEYATPYFTSIGKSMMAIMQRQAEQFPIEPHIQELLEMRYFRKKPDGTLLEHSWDDVVKRVARTITAAETAINEVSESMLRKIEVTYIAMMRSRLFLPNSPTLFNAGIGAIDKYPELYKKPTLEMKYGDWVKIYEASTSDNMHQLAACFVVEVEDSINGIMDTAKDIALITKSGGGIGLNISNLRAEGSPVHGTAGKASGPISFLHLYNEVLKTVEQGYKRRGAGMAIMDYSHPDAKKFIKAKHNNDGESVINMFNLSIGIRDDAEAMELINDNEMMDLIADNIWTSGDPGIIFLNNVNKTNPLKNKQEIRSTNPCGEEPLWPYTSCNLGSINLYDLHMQVKNHILDFGNVEDSTFGLALAWLSAWGTRFLDDVITASHYPIPKIQKSTKKQYRPIGLGLMGYASYLLSIHKKYQESEYEIRNITNILETISAMSSMLLVKVNNRNKFSLFNESEYTTGFSPVVGGDKPITINWHTAIEIDVKKYGKRNAITTTIAPTGSLSTIAHVSSGIEPIFMTEYTRKITMPDGTKKEVTIRERGLDNEKGDWIVTAQEIKPIDHIKIQSEAQKYISSAISKTINLPNEITKDEIKEIIKEVLSGKYFVKGLTMYRDGSLMTQVLNKKQNKELKEKNEKMIEVKDSGIKLVIGLDNKLHPNPRKDTLPAFVRRFKTPKGTVYITMTHDNNEVTEIFISDGHEKAEIIGRLSSLGLRSGISFDEIIKQLEKVGEGSFSAMLAKELKTMAAEIHKKPSRPNFENKKAKEEFIDKENLHWNPRGYYEDDEGNVYCSHCLAKNSLTIQEGCITCRACGVGKCN